MARVRHRPLYVFLYRSLPPDPQILDGFEEPEHFDFTHPPHPVSGIYDEADEVSLRIQIIIPSLQDVPTHPSRPCLGHMDTSSLIKKHFVLQPTLYAGRHSMYYSLLAVNT